MSTNETERDDASTDSASTEPVSTEPTESTRPDASTEAEGASTSSEPESGAAETQEAETSQTSEESGSAEPAAAAASAAAPSTSAQTKAAAAVTPGQRLAAQKAAKAAQKAAERARRAEESAASAESDESLPVAASVPDELELRAAEMRGVFEKNTNNLMKIGVGILAGLVIFAGVSAFMQHRARAAGDLLHRAVDASRAQIGSSEGQTDGRLRFATEAARDREAARRFRKVIAEHGGSDAARFAHLGLARLLMTEGKYAEAQTEVRAASVDVGGEPAIEALTLEASALAYTGEQKYAEAQRAIDRLGQIDRRRYRDVADYLTARVLFDRGDRNGAKEKLRALLDRLDDEGATPLEHVEDQARNLMRQIDPSAVPAAAPTQLSPELLQMLLQQQGLGGGAQ